MGLESQSVTVNVTPEEFFKVITDFEKYPEFVSTVKKCEIKRQDGNTFEVFFEIDLIKRVKYSLKMTAVPNKKLSWTFAGGDLFKVNSGSWEIEPANGGKATKAKYTADVDFALFVPKMITKTLVGVSLPRNLEEFKQRAESLHA